MVDTLLKLFLQQLHPAFAIPVAVVLAGLLLSITGKLKTTFDNALTIENARSAIPYVAGATAIAHTAIGLAAAYWFYFHTELFSPPVDPNLSHPLGRSYIRGTDWSAVAMGALLYAPLVMGLSRSYPRFRAAASIFILTVVPITAAVFAVAILQPALVTPNPSPPSIGTLLGFLWRYADIVLMALPIGLVMTAIWFLVSGIGRK